VADTWGRARMSATLQYAEDLILTALRWNRLGLAAVLNKKALSQTAQDARKSRAKVACTYLYICENRQGPGKNTTLSLEKND
jgi:hypothetical protein